MHLSKEDIQHLIIESAKQANILPIISKCDARCIFCSHKNNPPDVQVVRIGERSLDDIKSTLTYLNPNNVITIGESATTIIEGEPTLHRFFKEILTAIRDKFPNTPISITSNGRYLTEDLIRFLSSLKKIDMNISINSATIEGRCQLMGDNEIQARQAIKSIEYLHQYHIPFSCSMVAMPNITGYEDMDYTIQYIAKYGAACIRIFMPAFSSYCKEDIFPNPLSIHSELKEFIHKLSIDLPSPVLLEPSFVTDLTPRISGISFQSPAWNAGLRRDDVIINVNGQLPRSRVEAFKLLEVPGHIDVQVQRNNHIQYFSWLNQHHISNGVIMEYDFDMQRADYMKHIVETAPGFVLALTSEFAYSVIINIFATMNIVCEKYEIHYVKNLTFGGTIRAAGLLTCDDYINEYHEFCKDHPEPDGILIPSESFNYLGKDLTGAHITELQKSLNKPVAIV